MLFNFFNGVFHIGKKKTLQCEKCCKVFCFTLKCMGFYIFMHILIIILCDSRIAVVTVVNAL